MVEAIGQLVSVEERGLNPDSLDVSLLLSEESAGCQKETVLLLSKWLPC
jgi:hypothetical protein